MLQYKWGGIVLGRAKRKKQGDKRRWDAAKEAQGDSAKACESYWKREVLCSCFIIPRRHFSRNWELEMHLVLASVIANMKQSGFCPSDEHERLSFRVSQPSIYDTCKTNSILILSVWVFICPRFRPHQDADPEKPRVAALIDRLISFKNNDHGAWVRGGDILIQNSG